ncbi:FUSC family protein [Janibacter melonis]|uniref:FUSC family protein n=1 Tax=Janibacter melonis TaxID=262209 RepID=UPI0020945697|nr:FUSC family protein [Janibacter melonis]
MSDEPTPAQQAAWRRRMQGEVVTPVVVTARNAREGDPWARGTVMLVVKAAVAGTAAWTLASNVFDSSTPTYAPLAAMLVVERTIARSVSGSVQRLVAVLIGMLMAAGAGLSVGLHWWTMLPVLAVAVAIGRVPALGDHGSMVPTMALLSLITAGGTDTDFTVATMLETVMGGAIGILVNAVLAPPAHIETSRQRLRRIAGEAYELVTDVGEALKGGSWTVEEAQEWAQRSERLADEAPSVLAAVDLGQESTRMNPRMVLRRTDADWTGYRDAVRALRAIQAQIAGIAATLSEVRDPEHPVQPPSERYLEAFGEVLLDLAGGMSLLDRTDDAARDELTEILDRCQDRITTLGDEVYEAGAGVFAYGSLLVDATRMLQVVDAARPGIALPVEAIGPDPDDDTEAPRSGDTL